MDMQGSLCLVSSSENWLRDSLSTTPMPQTEAAHWSFVLLKACFIELFFHQTFIRKLGFVDLLFVIKKKKNQEVFFLKLAGPSGTKL